MPDKLIIHQLKATARLGVTEAERATPQPIWVDLELEIDAAAAARRDDVRASVDYAALVGAVIAVARQRPYALLETVAEAIARAVRQLGAPGQVRVRVAKRALPQIDHAAVEVVRGRRRDAPRKR